MFKKVSLFLCILLLSSTLSFAEEGFQYSNFKYRQTYRGCVDLMGEITNNTGYYYELSFFVIDFYNSSGEIIGREEIALQNFSNGQTKSFSEINCDINNGFHTYKVYFDHGLKRE